MNSNTPQKNRASVFLVANKVFWNGLGNLSNSSCEVALILCEITEAPRLVFSRIIGIKPLTPAGMSCSSC